jgi:hypothetical protein
MIGERNKKERETLSSIMGKKERVTSDVKKSYA